jgi:cell fate (sporulation/competence/biofilm development) regulator YlbF (YheA/YmcA/DUF963 family)
MNIAERAQELGRLVGQSEEYQALKRANDRLMEAKELREVIDRLYELRRGMTDRVERGLAPSPEEDAELHTLMSRVQSDPLYQGVVAAQTNFDKLMYRLNEQILEGIKRGAESRIITLG